MTNPENIKIQHPKLINDKAPKNHSKVTCQNLIDNADLETIAKIWKCSLEIER